MEKTAEEIERTLGPIDIWINNAMATVFSPVKDLTPEEYKRVTEVTYLGQVYGTMAVLKRMLARNRGTIVQVGSALAYRAIPLQAAYCGAKFGIRGFTDSLRTELIHDKSNIHLTMVQLPALNTPQFSWSRTHVSRQPQPVPPIFQPEVAARAIFWAATHKRREVWVGKPAVAAILLNKLFPSLADKYLADTGYESQMTKKKINHRAGNLFTPVGGAWNAHGIFDKNAKKGDFQFSFEKVPIVHYISDFILGILQGVTIVVNYIQVMLRF